MINGQSLLMLQLSWYTILNCTEVKCQKTRKKTPPKNHSSNLGVQKNSKHYAKIKLKFETILCENCKFCECVFSSQQK